jgi:eukaryotic-like serine/threonine-protein kinase
MSQSSTERDLLFGLLALQMDFISLEALATAMKTCAIDKDKPLSHVLQSQGALAKDDDGLLDSLVRRFMEINDNNAQRCLAGVTTVNAVRQELQKIGDPDLTVTLDYVANSAGRKGRGPDDTYPDDAGATGFGTGRFRLLHFHKKGGLGEVWVAWDNELNREVALKQIQDDQADDRQCQTRFLHEAEVTGRLEHRGIVPVYSLGQFENGRPYYAMRFVSGTSLKDAIDEFHEAKPSDPTGTDRSLELRRLLSRFVDVCNTVAYAHSRGVLHRDLKPGNIMLDEYGETLVVDWGLAKTGAVDVEAEADGVTRPPVSPSSTPYTWDGATMGTPGFMSPEQALGRLSELGPASDVYSLGATLYYLLTGKPPATKPDPLLSVPKVSVRKFPPLRPIKSTVPVALEAVCSKAMALSPRSRYASARDLGDEIERWLADQPVLAYPEPLSARALRWVRRRKQWVAAAAVLLMLTVLGLAITNWRITREQAKTTDQLAMTRDALRELLTVSGENLAFLPNTERLREHLAQLVLDRYQQLGNKFPTDPGVRLGTAQVHRVIGGIERLTGQFAKSQASYEKAIEGFTALCNNDSGQAEYRRWLVESYVDRGELNRMNGRTIDAEMDYRAAIGHADKLRSVPISPDYRRAMASALINFSEVTVLMGQHSAAQTAADQAVDLLRPLASPAVPSDRTTRDRWLLSMALTDRGVASKEAGDRDQAAHDFDEAAQVAGSVPPSDEIYDDSQDQLACIANHRGELLSADRSKLPESEKAYEQADQILSVLTNKHKVMPLYREQMAATLCGRAAVRLASNRVADSRRDCEAAQGHVTWLIAEQARKGAPENPQYLSLLGQVLIQHSRIHFLQGRMPEGRSTRVEAVERLSRAIELDPARVADKARLEQIKAVPARSEE